MKQSITTLIILLTALQFCNGQSKTEQLDSLLTSFNDSSEFNGTVLVAENGNILIHNAYGFSDFETKQKLNTSSIFNIASATKPFTALCILILHDRGKLNIDDDITKHLPKLDYKGVTIRHMLNHTSGLVDFSNEFDKVKDLIDVTKPFGNKELLTLLENKNPPLNFTPGEKYSYSNTAYNLLSAIVEDVSGKPFEKFLQKEIFDPIGMKSTYLGDTFIKGNENTKGYRYRNGEYIPDSLSIYIKALRGTTFEFSTQGSGGIRSTTGDLFLFDQALRNGKLVKPETLEQAYTKAKTNDGKEIAYGFGWRVYEDAMMKSVYHGGSVPGYRVLFRRGIKNDMNTVILLSNATNANGFKILNGINGILND